MTADDVHAVPRLETEIVVVLAEGLGAAEAANAAAVLALRLFGSPRDVEAAG